MGGIFLCTCVLEATLEFWIRGSMFFLFVLNLYPVVLKDQPGRACSGDHMGCWALSPGLQAKRPTSSAISLTPHKHFY